MAKVMKSRHVRGCKLPLLFVLSVSFGFVSEAFDKTAVNATQGTGTWWTEGSNWSPAGVPGSTDECLIKTTKGYEVNKFGANTANTVFTGKSLQIGEVGSDPGNGLVILVDSSSTSYTLSFPNDGLVFGHASFRAWDSVPNAVINGDLTVLSTSSAPSDFSAAKANTTYTLNGNLIGGSAAVLKLAEESDIAQLHFPLTFNASAFYGSLVYEPHTKPIKSTFGSVTFNGPMFDIHDNEVVNLSIDKVGAVRVGDRVIPSPAVQEKSDKLNSEEASRYWDRLQASGFTDKEHRLLPTTTRKQAMLIAEAFAEFAKKEGLSFFA